MKGLILFAAFLSCATLYGQTTSGIIEYENVVKMDIQVDGLPPEVVAQLPKEQKNKKILYFNPQASVYQNPAEKEKQESTGYKQDDIVINISHEIPDEKTYIDIPGKKLIEQKDLMGRLFLIESAAENRKWKMTGKQKKILGYACSEAVGISKTDTVTAWFTSSIPVNIGPDDIIGLPGMVLEATMGNLTVKALKVTPDANVASYIKKPKNGKKVTKEEYEKLKKEKMEELQKEYGGKGNVIIKTVRN